MVERLNSISKSLRIFNVETDAIGEQAKTVTGAITGKIVYCNGMTTSHELALDHVRTIKELTGVEVELHYNNTTSSKKALKITGKFGIACLAIAYAIASRGRMIGLAGIASFIAGVMDFNKIEKEKNDSAKLMAIRVAAYLDANPLHHMLLILHSQGADIGHRALEKLSAYKHRINVVAIGGMIDIPDGLALRVVNFVNDNDMITHISKTLFDSNSGTKTNVQIEDKKSPYLDSHYSSDYLKRDVVQKTILALAKPSYVGSSNSF
jgi:hypothetical protein